MQTLSHPTVRVLIVQNEAITRELWAHLLQMGGYDVLSSETGESALTMARRWRGRIDGLVTAVKLPGLVDGWMVADAFRLCNPLRPIVYSCDADEDLDWREPNATFIRLPMSPLDLLERVKRMIKPASEAGSATLSEPMPVLLAS